MPQQQHSATLPPPDPTLRYTPGSVKHYRAPRGIAPWERSPSRHPHPHLLKSNKYPHTWQCKAVPRSHEHCTVVASVEAVPINDVVLLLPLILKVQLGDGLANAPRGSCENVWGNVRRGSGLEITRLANMLTLHVSSILHIGLSTFLAPLTASRHAPQNPHHPTLLPHLTCCTHSLCWRAAAQRRP